MNYLKISLTHVRKLCTKPQLHVQFKELSKEEILRPLIQCRNRPFLAGGHSQNLPEFLNRNVNKYFKGIKLVSPSSLSPSLSNEDFASIGENIKGYVDQHLPNYSAFLIKGIPMTESLHFHKLIEGMDLKSIVYDAGNASRQNVGGYIYTASDEPKEVSIEPHNELSYLEDNYASKIMFFCVSAADVGGDNAIVFNRDVIKDLSAELVEKVKERKIRYVRNLQHQNNSSYMTWQETFKTNDTKKVEEIMKRERMAWEWRKNGDLSLWSIGNATITHPITGEEIWFNQLTAAHSTYYKTMPVNINNQDLEPNEYTLNTTYGDGEEFEDEVIDEIRAALWGNAMAFKLQKGDLLILDNLLAMHSRTSYEDGGKREILVHLSF